jgi:hypothetical protein
MKATTLTLKTSNFRQFLTKLAEVARHAIELHLQTCQIIAEAHQRKR